MSEDLSYPIGKFRRPDSLSSSEFDAAVTALSTQPARFREVVSGLSDAQLDTPYRPGGWTVRMLAHHVPDSHLNMYLRLKVALTESKPTVKTYDQDAWSTMADVSDVPVPTSLQLFENVQARTVAILRHVSPAERQRTFMHPDNGEMSVDQLIAMYTWHGDHHIAHVKNLRLREGW